MGIKFSDMADDELGAMVRDRFTRLAQAHDAGLSDEHPRDAWNRDNETLRKYRAAAAGAPVEDNPPDFAGKPANPTLAKPAQDGRFETGTDGVARFTSNGRTVTGDQALIARARASNPSTVRRMTAAIKGYGRIK